MDGDQEYFKLKNGSAIFDRKKSNSLDLEEILKSMNINDEGILLGENALAGVDE